MSGFDPGPGWRQVAEADILLRDEVISYASEYGAGPTWWIREAPVPALPEEPYTVIRVTWKPTGHPRPDVLMRDDEDEGWLAEEFGIDAEELARSITGFEVLASPANQWDCIGRMEQVKHDTAKAVIDRVRAHVEDQGEDPDHPMFGLHAIAREFGVSS